MGLKKYEIITVGSDKRVRALRSWQVGDRYVNIGDVGGIVYDEKTLSQDGACWLFRGNFGFPGARIGGDSIVDVGETTLGATGAPNVDILGSSVVVGSKLLFESDQTAADAVVLKTTDFEPGMLNYAEGSDWETWKRPSANFLRTKAPIFTGGVATTLKLEVPGYTVQAYVLDRDGKGVTATAATDTGAGVTLAIPAGQYFMLTLAKNPLATIALSDVTVAKITFTGTYETKLSIIDSHVEINPATSAGTTAIRPGGTLITGPRGAYPEAVIRNSKVPVNVPASANRVFRIMGQIIESTAFIDAVAGSVTLSGIYSNINNLAVKGIASASIREIAYNSIQATNCNDFTVSPTTFPGLEAAQVANMPFIFQGCNVPNGRFYHHAQIANTYKNIDFAKAQADLGKTFGGSVAVVSSEVEGMYRLATPASGLIGSLVESFASVEKLTFSNFATVYGTTIYKDAYLDGLFDFAGTNVFGNAVKRPVVNTQDISALLAQGAFNSITPGQTLTGVTGSANAVSIQTPFRVTGPKGFTVQTPPTGLAVLVVFTDANNKIITNTSWITVETPLTNVQLQAAYAYLSVKRVDNTALTPSDVAGVTVTTYNGCKLVNTKETGATIAGNVRVEENATLIDTSVTGTGYFGGNSIVQAPSDLVAPFPVEGAAYMSDNAVFAPTVANASAGVSILEMRDNAVFAGQINNGSTGYNITMTEEARCLGTVTTLGGFVMRDNSFIATAGVVVSTCRGLLVMRDNARIESGSLTAIGYITLCGRYRQTATKTWTGKRVIDSQDAPTYDNNVKTQYDF